MEKTLLLIKPDAIQRGLIGEILSRFENKGLKISGMKMIQLNDKMLAEHYSHINTKPFFGKIVKFMKSSPVIVCCIEGVEAVETVRRLSGVTKSREAQPGTIRGDYGMSIQTNLIHTSDSIEAAIAEVARFFGEGEIFVYHQELTQFIYSEDEFVI